MISVLEDGRELRIIADIVSLLFSGAYLIIPRKFQVEKTSR